MAEMADASDLGSGFFGSGGSTPSMGIFGSVAERLMQPP